MPRKKRWTPTIRQRTDKYGYHIDLGRRFTGKRIVLTERTMEEAKTAAREAADRWERLGAVATRLKAEEIIWAADAMEILPDGVTLRDAAEAYVEDLRLVKDSESDVTYLVGFVIDEMIRNMGRKECQEVSKRSARSRISILFQDVSTPIGDYSTVELQGRLDVSGQGKSAQTRRHYVSSIKQLFRYAKKMGWIAVDPSEALDKPKVERTMAEFMSVDHVAFLLRNIGDDEARLQLLLGFFAGIRPEEIKKLTVDAINVDEEMITIRPEVAKTRAVRHITIAENLGAWLRLPEYQLWKGTPLVAPNYDRNNRLRRKLIADKEMVWPADCARHTFGTMHCAMFGDATLTAAEMGHTNGVDTFYAHYRGLATKADAEKYWGIRP